MKKLTYLLTGFCLSVAVQPMAVHAASHDVKHHKTASHGESEHMKEVLGMVESIKKKFSPGSVQYQAIEQLESNLKGHKEAIKPGKDIDIPKDFKDDKIIRDLQTKVIELTSKVSSEERGILMSLQETAEKLYALVYYPTLSEEDYKKTVGKRIKPGTTTLGW